MILLHVEAGACKVCKWLAHFLSGKEVWAHCKLCRYSQPALNLLDVRVLQDACLTRMPHILLKLHSTLSCRLPLQVLAAFLKCIGHIIPLMDAVYANYYTREVMFILVREFQTPDEEMKKIVLKVVKQCVGTEGVEPEYIRTDILGPFFANFWVRRMALDRRNYRQLVETTVELANKVCVCSAIE